MAISHTIISTIRPRTFISPILYGIGYFINRKFGSKTFINLIAGLGFSASYHDIQQLELSILYHSEKPTPPGTFCQYAFDNADFNVATLDGFNTFHNLGGIKCITPAHAIPPADNIIRLKSAPSAAEVGELGVIKLIILENARKNALQEVIVQDLNAENPIPADIFTPSLPDVLWMFGKWLNSLGTTVHVPGIPEWKGFMKLMCKTINPDKCLIKPLPFINFPPSDLNTLYTALKLAAEDCHQQGSKTCLVTFDLPLYIKAREIVCTCSDDPLFKSIVVRLGGFHMLMSYLGCIGYIMAGSGLKEVLCCVFAPNSVDKMLTGHAYSRAVRGHLLVQTVLARIMLDSVGVSSEEQNMITNMFLEIEQKTEIAVSENAQLTLLQEKLNNELARAKENGPTAALWVQYFNMVSLMKKFIVAERCGDWNSHLLCAQQMIPFFHASGHFQYAKFTHLYVQDMLALAINHPDVLEQFVTNGYFTVNRSGSLWAGVWTDMAIEQSLMRPIKSSGGLTRGRGTSDSVLAKFIGGFPAAADICSSLEEFAGAVFCSGEQHVDFRVSRQQRDKQDQLKMYEWFNDHPPLPQIDSLISLSTGIIGNIKTNCHQALEVGTQTMNSIVGSNFSSIKLSRKNVVLSLASINSAIKLNNETVVVDPLMIFQRTIILKKNDEDIADLLRYELSPFPLALFNEKGMRKTKKSSLYDALPQECTTINFQKCSVVIDGGFLLHRVKWNVGCKYSTICDQYIEYLLKHYGENCSVVFDGYGDINSTKRAEQMRRGTTRTSADINFNENMAVTVNQEHFLSNEKNKTRLIEFLTLKMAARGIDSKVASGDADTSIVKCSIEKATSVHVRHVVVVGEDVDLVVLLIALTPPENNIYFFKPGKGKVESKLFSTKQLQQLPISRAILLLHAFSGCDTTSAIHRKSKATIVHLFNQQQNQMTEITQIFYSPLSKQDIVAEAGEKLFLALFKVRNETDLNEFRYLTFLQLSTKIKTDLSALPPTKGAARQHSLRVYLQVQQWLGNSLSPEEWGWARSDNGYLFPVTTNEALAPDAVLKTIFCRCITGCGGRCGCRKAGLCCTFICGNCHGDCSNCLPLEDEELELEQISNLLEE